MDSLKGRQNAEEAKARKEEKKTRRTRRRPSRRRPSTPALPACESPPPKPREGSPTPSITAADRPNAPRTACLSRRTEPEINPPLLSGYLLDAGRQLRAGIEQLGVLDASHFAGRNL